MSGIITQETLKFEQCSSEITQILNKYGMILVPVFAFDGKKLDVRCNLMPKGQATAQPSGVEVNDV